MTYEKDDFTISDIGGWEEKVRVLPTAVKPLTLWLHVQMLYHTQSYRRPVGAKATKL